MILSNSASKQDILKHLIDNKESIFIGFKSIPDLENYAEKILNRAILIEYWEENNLCGILACYLNDYESRIGFLTLVSINNLKRNMGIGTRLMKELIIIAFKKGFKKIKLNVNINNYNAVRFYEKCGFTITEQKNDTYAMFKDLILTYVYEKYS